MSKRKQAQWNMVKELRYAQSLRSHEEYRAEAAARSRAYQWAVIARYFRRYPSSTRELEAA